MPTAAYCDAMNDELTRRRRDLSASCTHVQGAESEADFVELERVAAWCKANDVRTDVYGEGTGLEAFEERVADMLGYPAARFMPTGTMAQQIAARIWSERSGVDRIGNASDVPFGTARTTRVSTAAWPRCRAGGRGSIADDQH